MLLETDNYRQFLTEELARRMRHNPSYSQRAFSRQLGMSPGELSEILNGKRKLSLRSVLRIAQTLGLNPTETKHLAFLVQVEKTKDLGKGELLKSGKELLEELPKTNQVSQAMFTIVSDWYHFAIINLAETEGFRWNVQWISKRLGISKTEAVLALGRLERVGLIEKVKGRYTVTKDYVQATEGIPSEAIRRYHQQVLKIAVEAIDLQSVTEREMSGISFAVSKKALISIKKDMSEFLDQIIAKYSKEKAKQEVYHLEMALFRLSKGENNA